MTNLLIIGDSLTAIEGSWTQIFLNEPDKYSLRIDAWIGRKITSFAVPQDVIAWGRSPLIYFLGGNDTKPESDPDYLLKMFDDLVDMYEKGFDPHVVLFPEFYDDPKIKEVRANIAGLCAYFKIPMVDINEIWEPGLAPDRVHPLPGMSAKMGPFIKNGFGL